MHFKNLLKRLLPFSIAIMVSFVSTNFLTPEQFVGNITTPRIIYIHKEQCEGLGFTNCKGEHWHFNPIKEAEKEVDILSNNALESLPNRSFKILAQPRAEYTEEGRNNNVNGVVRLVVEFLSSGKIGKVKVISGLPFGLTEKAIEAAKKIKFIPTDRTVKKTVEYRFTLY
jgi:hypothetical protein